MRKFEMESFNLVFKALCEASRKTTDAQNYLAAGNIAAAQVALADIDGLTCDSSEILGDIIAILENGSLQYIFRNIDDLSDQVEDIYNFLPDDEEEEG